jgi:hypothetical protein
MKNLKGDTMKNTEAKLKYEELTNEERAELINEIDSIPFMGSLTELRAKWGDDFVDTAMRQGEKKNAA